MAKKTYTDVGRVVRLHRYPVKSMGGEVVEEARIGWHGIDGDRRFAFVRSEDCSGAPWLTAREVPQMIRYTARFEAPGDPRRSLILVTTPDGLDLPLRGEELRGLLVAAHGGPVHLMQLYSGTYDAMDLSLVTTATVRALGDLIGEELDPLRFRPNVLMEAYDGRPYPEDRLIGETLVFGDRPDSARISIKRKDARCAIVNIDPVTGERNPAVLREIVKQRKNLAGVYATTEFPGTARVGDVVRLVT